MMVEALKPLRIRLSDTGEEIDLVPRVPRDLPEPQALKLLAKIPGKVRPCDPTRSHTWKSGALISWKSPLFGRCTGQIALEPEGGWMVIRAHSVTGDLALISLDWDVRLE